MIIYKIQKYTFYCVVFLLFTFKVYGDTKTNQLYVFINSKGNITIEMKLENIVYDSSSHIILKDYIFQVVTIPFSIYEESKFISSSDVKVNIFTVGPGFTTLAVLAPKTMINVLIRINNCYNVTETADGKFQLEFDMNFPLMSKSERELFEKSLINTSWKLNFILPKVYDEKLINYSPKDFIKLNDNTFSIKCELNQLPKGWLVFPSSIKIFSDIGKLIISLLIGFFTIILHIPALRDRKLNWQLTVLGLSIVIIIAFLGFSLFLVKNWDFMIWSAMVAPHVLFGLGSSIFLILAMKYEAIIGGQIQIDGANAEFVEVVLISIENGEQRIIKSTDKLKYSRYNFYVWLDKDESKFKITAKSLSTNSKSSEIISLHRGDKHEVSLINLERLTIES